MGVLSQERFESLYASIIAERPQSHDVKQPEAPVPPVEAPVPPVASEPALIADLLITPEPVERPASPQPVNTVIETTATEVGAAQPRPERRQHQRRAWRERARTVGGTVLAIGLGTVIMRTVFPAEAALNSGEAPSSSTEQEATKPVVNLPDPTEATITIPATTLPETTTTAAETTTTTVPETTTTIAAPPTTEAAPLSLTGQIMTGQVSLAERRGMELGMLRLDKFCDDVRVYINNSIDFTNADYVPLLSPEAQAKVAELQTRQLNTSQRRILEDDIQQYGLIGGDGQPTGDPLYALYPDNTPEDGCAPAAPNPRDNQVSYGSSQAVNAGGAASQWQPTAILSEFGGIPGQATTTYIEGHRSSQSAAFNGLVQYALGDTVSYTVDGQTRVYQLVRTEEVDGSTPLPNIMEQLNSEGGGSEQLVLQVCVDGNNAVRSLYVFTPVQA